MPPRAAGPPGGTSSTPRRSSPWIASVLLELKRDGPEQQRGEERPGIAWAGGRAPARSRRARAGSKAAARVGAFGKEPGAGPVRALPVGGTRCSERAFAQRQEHA